MLECKSIDGLVWRASQDELVDGVLRAHWWQVQHYAETIDAPGAVISYLVNGNELIVREVPRNKLVGTRLRLHEAAWWRRHIVGQEPPTQGTPDDRMTLLEKLHAKESAGMLQTDASDLIDLARRYVTLDSAVKAAEQAKNEAKADLCSIIGAAEGLDFGKGIGKVTWKANKHGTRTLRVSLRDAEEQDQ